MRSRRDLLRVLSAAAIGGSLFVAASSAHAQGYFGQNQVQYQTFDWRILRTEHFDVHYYPAEAEGAKIAARMAERSYARLSRLLSYTFKERKPIVIFASRGDFAQSNVFGDLGEQTGGVTDPVHQRNTFFLGADLAETEHVMTHEMVHVFQFDVYARGHSGSGLQTLMQNPPPSWFMEGMAEYLSVGPDHPATDAIMRDAALNGNLPTMKQLTERPDRFFPYRFGEAFWRFIGQRWGDEIIGEILSATPTLGVDRAFKRHTGFDLSELGDEWKETMQTTYLPAVANLERPRKIAQPLLNAKRTGGIIPVYVAPAFSPDGRQIAYISSGSLLRAEVFLDLYLADATTGKRLKRLTSSTLNPEFEELRYIYSQSAFSPDGRTLAFTAQTEGRDVLYLVDVRSLNIVRKLTSGLESMIGPTWSPDGKQIIFSGAKGGFTNLYKIDSDGRNLVQLTTGDFAALMPSWSPDGRSVAFVSDRGGSTDFALLKFGKWRINLLDLQSGNIEVIPGQGGKNLNPNWAPDGKSLAYISDRTGIAQLYIYDFDAKEHYQITKFIGGVQSVTEHSPAISWARQADKIAFTYMDNDNFTIWSLANPRQLKGQPYRDAAPVATVARTSAADSAQIRVNNAAAALAAIAARQQQDAKEQATKAQQAVPAPIDSTGGRRLSVYRGPAGLRSSDALPAAGQPGAQSAISVAALLDSAVLALPDPNTFTEERYKPTLRPEAIQRPQIGYAQNNYGRGVFGGTAIIFGDLLGNRQLTTAAAINGRIDEAQLFVNYVSLSHRLSWSAGFQQQPYFFLANAQQNNLGGNQLQIAEEIDRFIIRSAFFSSIYPRNRFERFEIGASFTNIDKSAEYISQLADAVTGYSSGYYVDSIKGTGSFDFASPYVAYVADNALWGSTGPIYGHRYRMEVGANVGTKGWMSYIADIRRYDAIIFSYLTLATRLYANVNVGSGEALFPQYIGQPQYIRGYDREAYLSANCGGLATGSTGNTGCSATQLLGSRVALGSVELRFPLIRRFDLGFLPITMPPIDGEFFYDAGMAWNGGQKITLTKPANYDPATMRFPLRSFGYGVRVNMFNIATLKFDYAIPRDGFSRAGYWWWSIGQSF